MCSRPRGSGSGPGWFSRGCDGETRDSALPSSLCRGIRLGFGRCRVVADQPTDGKRTSDRHGGRLWLDGEAFGRLVWGMPMSVSSFVACWGNASCQAPVDRQSCCVLCVVCACVRVQWRLCDMSDRCRCSRESSSGCSISNWCWTWSWSWRTLRGGRARCPWSACRRPKRLGTRRGGSERWWERSLGRCGRRRGDCASPSRTWRTAWRGARTRHKRETWWKRGCG